MVRSTVYKPAFAERDKKQTVIDLRGIATNWLKTNYDPPQGFLGYGLRLQQQSTREMYRQLCSYGI
jgi:hypothetical protein